MGPASTDGAVRILLESQCSRRGGKVKHGGLFAHQGSLRPPGSQSAAHGLPPASEGVLRRLRREARRQVRQVPPGADPGHRRAVLAGRTPAAFCRLHSECSPVGASTCARHAARSERGCSPRNFRPRAPREGSRLAARGPRLLSRRFRRGDPRIRADRADQPERTQPRLPEPEWSDSPTSSTCRCARPARTGPQPRALGQRAGGLLP